MPPSVDPASTFRSIHERVGLAGERAGHRVNLVAVGKTHPADALRALHALGQHAFGENYVQEAYAKQRMLADCDIEWHLIGALQSNKARDAAERFDWVQTIDRERVAEALARWRPSGREPLDVLIQVNIDAEASKAGCPVDAIGPLAERIATMPTLRLRGLMAIPAPSDSPCRADAFARMARLHAQLRLDHLCADTLSMGMSDDYELAIVHGATMVRIGSALFGPR